MRKCDRNRDGNADPCSADCDPDLDQSITITPETTEKQINDLNREGFWFFQNYEKNGKPEFIRISTEHMQKIVKNKLFWESKRVKNLGVIASPPKCWERDPEMVTYYHATDPSRVEAILRDGLESSETNPDACSCENGVYVATDEIDAFQWGLQLLKEGQIYDKPIILAIEVPSNVQVVEDPNPIVKSEYPSSFIICTKHGIPRNFIKKAYPLTPEEIDESEMEYLELLREMREENDS